MASIARDDDDLITGINVTPLVDITLVLLVIMMITASYVVSRSIPMDLPTAATGENHPTTLSVSITRDGALYLDATPITEDALRARIHQAAAADPETRAVIAADGDTAHHAVVRVIDLLRREKVTRFAINVSPEELTRRERKH